MNPSDQEDSLVAEGETEVDDHENQTLEQGDVHVIIPNTSRGRLDISDNWEELPSITPVKEWMKTGGHHQKEASCQKRLPQSIQNQEHSINRGISNSPPPLVEMITVPYRHHRIRIFRKPAGSHQVMHRYFYDPVVQLDPQSVVSRENYLQRAPSGFRRIQQFDIVRWINISISLYSATVRKKRRNWSLRSEWSRVF